MNGLQKVFKTLAEVKAEIQLEECEDSVPPEFPCLHLVRHGGHVRDIASFLIKPHSPI